MLARLALRAYDLRVDVVPEERIVQERYARKCAVKLAHNFILWPCQIRIGENSWVRVLPNKVSPSA